MNFDNVWKLIVAYLLTIVFVVSLAVFFFHKEAAKVENRVFTIEQQINNP